MEEQRYTELLQAIERNTAATRAIAVFMLGWIVWFLIGAGVVAAGAVLGAASPDYRAGILGAGIIAFGGVVIILVGAIRSIAIALRELAKSSK